MDPGQRSLRLPVVETDHTCRRRLCCPGAGSGRLFSSWSIAGAFGLASARGRHGRQSGYHVGCVVLMLLVVLLRKPLIVNPLTRFRAHLMIQPETEEEDDDDDDEEYE